MNEEEKLKQIRNLFWELTPEVEGRSKSSNVIKMAVYKTFGLEITNIQEKVIFDTFESHIIGEIIGGGFKDFETTDKITEHIESEFTKDDLIEMLKEKPKQNKRRTLKP